MTKAIDRLGKVDDGTSVSDYDPEEISRKISINLSLGYTFYKGYKINIIDVPGFFDFEGEMVAALTVADAAIVVTSASGSLSVGAEKAIDYCLEKGKAMFLFVNGVNKENSSYFNTIDAFTQKYGNKILPIELPIMEGTQMKGYVDVLEGKAFDTAGKETAVPANLADKLAECEGALLELAAEADDSLLEKYFEGEPLTAEGAQERPQDKDRKRRSHPRRRGRCCGQPHTHQASRQHNRSLPLPPTEAQSSATPKRTAPTM